ncbi:MAG: aldolase/citrate lyase family protein [Oscillospiraceae bacterium]|nr:aldolase/citrate lyase family protein [Oscillospiraceae bacterium]
MNRHELKQAFTGGKVVYSTLVGSTSPKWAAEIAKTGVDFVFIDSEHLPMNPETRGWMLRCYRAMGIAPIVRIAACTYQEAFHAIEHGAEGVIAPYVETVEEVKTLLAAVKYRPLKGERLRAVLDGREQLSFEEQAYLDKYNDGYLVLLNIESRVAVDNLEQLLLPGVDGVFIGPHDLSINLGIPEQYDHPLFEQYVARVIEVCKARGVGMGNHSSWDISAQIRWAQQGMGIILWNSDIGCFVGGISGAFAQAKQALGQGTAEQINVHI